MITNAPMHVAKLTTDVSRPWVTSRWEHTSSGWLLAAWKTLRNLLAMIEVPDKGRCIVVNTVAPQPRRLFGRPRPEKVRALHCHRRNHQADRN